MQAGQYNWNGISWWFQWLPHVKHGWLTLNSVTYSEIISYRIILQHTKDFDKIMSVTWVSSLNTRKCRNISEICNSALCLWDEYLFNTQIKPCSSYQTIICINNGYQHFRSYNIPVNSKPSLHQERICLLF